MITFPSTNEAPFPVLISPPSYPKCSGISDETMAQWTREAIRRQMVAHDRIDADEMEALSKGWYSPIEVRS
jgi:hypothetical protein